MPFNGKFWPIVCPKWWSDPQTDTPGGVSVHFLDPYSLVHIQTGVISFYLTGYPLKYILDKYYFEQNSASPDDLSSWPLWVGFGIILTLSAIFEIVENAQCTIDKYRMASGTSADYAGDSYQNIIADLIVVQLGYMISWIFFWQKIAWMSAVWFTVVDTFLVLYMRDSVVLFFNVFIKSQEEVGSHGDGRKSAINPLYNPPKPKTESGHSQVNPTFPQP